MAFQPFDNAMGECRVIEIPSGIDAAARASFVASVREAVALQAKLAERCGGILRTTGEVLDERDFLIVPHEPARPLRPALVVQSEARPDIGTVWWATRSILEGLYAFEEVQGCHGGLNLGSLCLDERGLVKVTDFGIAPSYEGVCGRESRRSLLCESGVETATGGWSRSGVWQWVPDASPREYGWIAPYFARELLEDERHGLQSRFDQFSAGVALYLFATGGHPYSVELSDPILYGYFLYFAPLPLGDLREDWRDTLEAHARGGIVPKSGEAVTGWAELVVPLVGYDAGDRYASFGEAVERARAGYDPAWARAEDTLRKSQRLLEARQTEAYLESVGPLAEDAALPGVWREQLSAWLEDVGEVLRERQALYDELEHAKVVRNESGLDAAVDLAEKVLTSPYCDEALRRRAEELKGEVEVIAAFLREQFAAAPAALAQWDFETARLVANQTLQDPALGNRCLQGLADEAGALLEEIDRSQARFDELAGELDAAERALAENLVDEGERRCRDVLEQPEVPAPIAQRAEALVEGVAALREADERLSSAALAWQAGDLEALTRGLDDVRVPDEAVRLRERYDELRGKAAVFREAVEKRAAAEAALEERPAEALALANEAAAFDPLPEGVAADLAAFVDQCREVLRRGIDEALQQAWDAFKEGRIEACLTLLDVNVFQVSGVPDDFVETAEQLRDYCVALQKEMEQVDSAERALEGGRLEEARELTMLLDTERLPQIARQIVEQRKDVLLERIEKAARDREAALAERLGEAERRLSAGELTVAEGLLEELGPLIAGYGALIKRREQLLGRLQAALPLAERLEEADSKIGEAQARLQGGDEDAARRLIDEARGKVASLPEEMPAWAAERAGQLRQACDGCEAAVSRMAADRVRGLLDEAEQAIDAGDAAGAMAALDRAATGVALEASLAERHGALRERLSAVAIWRERLERLGALVAAKSWAEAQSAAAECRQGGDVPAFVDRELKQFEKTIASAVEAAQKQAAAKRRAAEEKRKQAAELAAKQAARREEIAELLVEAAELVAVLETRRDPRVRDLRRQLREVASDALAEAEQQAGANALLEKVAALPGGGGAGRWIGIGVVAAGLLGAVGWFALGGGGGGTPEPVVSPKPAPVPVVERTDDVPVETEPEQPALVAAESDVEGGRDQQGLLPESGEVEPGGAVATGTEAPPAAVEPEPVEPSGAERAAREAQEKWRAAQADLIDELTQAANAVNDEADDAKRAEAWAKLLKLRGIGGVDRITEAAAVLGMVEADVDVEAQTTESVDESLTATIRLKVGDDAVVAEGTASFKWESGEAAVEKALDIEAMVQAASVVVLRDIDKEIEAALALAQTPKLLDTHAKLGDVDTALDKVGKFAAADTDKIHKKLAEVRRGLPEAWGDVEARLRAEGFAGEASDFDEATGYPRVLREGEGGLRWRLVAVPPNDDEKWESVDELLGGQAQVERAWALFYVCESERSGPIDKPFEWGGGDLAAIPTRLEWVLAALTYGEGDSSYFTGMAEWCREGDETWVVGGSASVPEAYRERVLGETPDGAAIVEWLTKPLMMQRRAYGDGLATVRPVLSVLRGQ